ncbi:MAG: glycosyltransferase family 2 protein, partial [Muribaculaceae bacterium]|nr:glycosyltransferase family 2 protein [Muribaculaceae bacterium]
VMITVSLVTYHTSLEELQVCLNSLNNPLVKRIFVVDNSAMPEIEQFCAPLQNVEYIQNTNTGYGTGHNIAMRKALKLNPDYHLILNTDVYFKPEILNELTDYLNQNPDVGQLQPRLTYPDGRLQYSVRMLPSPIDVFARRFLPSSWVEKRTDRYILADLDHSSIQNIPFHQGSFMLLRASALKEVGLFDERFFLYTEDIDLTRRVHARYKTIYYPYATVIHSHRQESYKNFRLMMVHSMNMIRYFNKWGWLFDNQRKQWNNHLDNLIKESKKKS